MKKYRCKYCKDTGVVQIAPNVKGLKRCPYCKNKREKLLCTSTYWYEAVYTAWKPPDRL